MSKHERRASRQSQLKLKVKGKDSAVQMARTEMLLAPKQQLPPQMARTGVLHWLAPISNSNRMRNICRNGARSEADLARLRRGASSPLSFFVAVGAIFSTSPCQSEAHCKDFQPASTYPTLTVIFRYDC